MSAYRFCRTDDIGLLVAALNRCWSPYFPDQPPVTPEAFKRSIRDLQVWCSSCMVAFSGSDPIAVLIGAKRSSGTLVHKIAVHPDHGRQGHGRHLLASLGSSALGTLANAGLSVAQALTSNLIEQPWYASARNALDSPTRLAFAASGLVATWVAGLLLLRRLMALPAQRVAHEGI